MNFFTYLARVIRLLNADYADSPTRNYIFTIAKEEFEKNTSAEKAAEFIRQGIAKDAPYV